jgi:hypothetical protein
VPLIYHRNRREGVLDFEVVAVPLHELYGRGDGKLRHASRDQLAAAFGLSRHTRIIAVGSGRDKPIEEWWGLSTQRQRLIVSLCDLGITFATSPNYSLFTDVPRYDNLYNIKRIVIAWQEFIAGNLSCALHLNARTHKDYQRLAQFIHARDEVSEVAFEFATGAAWPGRRLFHQRHLAELASHVSRPLHLVMVGGITAIPALAAAYEGITYIDTSAFMKTMHRRRLLEGNDGKLLGRPELTEAGTPLDALLLSNIKTMRMRVERLISESRKVDPVVGTAPMLATPETAPSDPTAPASDLAAAR